ncbi:unnamed protein product, partial [Brenthis ino]
MESSCTRFTAAEGGARLAAYAGSKNILVTEHTAFISTSVLIEHAYKIRGLLSSGRQRSIFITRLSRIECVAHELTILTDLAVFKAKLYSDVSDWKNELEYKEVLVCTSEVFKMILHEKILAIPNVNVLIIDSCHLIFKDENLQYIMNLYKQHEENKRPRILALTYPLFTAPKDEQTDTQEEAMDGIDKKEINDCITEKDNERYENEETKMESNEKFKVTTNKDDGSCERENEIKDSGSKKKNYEMKDTFVKSDFGVYNNMDDFDMYEKLEWKIEEFEKALCCEIDLAEDIDGGKRLSATAVKPKEVIIEYSPQVSSEDLPDIYVELERYMKDTVYDALDFINEHRYDPTEIYGEDLYEEFMKIPDPTVDPKQIFMEFLYVLEQLGPYAADKAAFSLLTKLEKLKIKVPYERHFLLLCLCTSVFVKIRCYADLVFSKYESDWEKITMFSTPKVLRLAEILEQFQPDNQKDVKNSPDCNINAKDNINTTDSNTKNDEKKDITKNDEKKDITKNDETIVDSTSDDIDKKKNIDTTEVCDNNDADSELKERNEIDSKNESEMKKSKTMELLNELEKCDFVTLGNKIEDRVNTYEANLKDIEDYEVIVDSGKSDSKNGSNKSDSVCVNDKGTDVKVGFGKRGHRSRGRRVQRSNVAKMQQMQQNSDALCGIVFLREALMAKILFMMIVDMSRSRPSLSHLCAQYCASEDGRDKDSQREGKKQEEVLKKFRMHECNLLLATSVLEEGIDLPRCNLVVRWDVPPSYRSHGLCRGRARAPRAAVALLAGAADSDALVHNLAVYKELDQIITRKCGCGIQFEPPQEEENQADSIAYLVKPYIPLELISNTNRLETDNKSNVGLKIDINNDNANADIIITNDNDMEDDNVRTKDNDREINKEMDTNKHTDNVINKLNMNLSKIHINMENGELEMDMMKEDVNRRYKEYTNEIREENKKMNIEKECHETLDFREQDKIGDVETKCDDLKFDYKLSDKKCDENVASVDLNSAIALINRYCSKLPSDTFTRLAPQWWMEQVRLPDRHGVLRTAYICTLRMPLNCPVKYNIVGHPMPTRVLARRVAALLACRALHRGGELDDHLVPIGKENFKAAELESSAPAADSADGDSARPGTTKRRQYYYKRTAWEFTDCQAIIDATDEEIEKNPVLDGKQDGAAASNVLHLVQAALWCALPERYNTRGRRLHAPQRARHAVAVLMRRAAAGRRLQIPAFPVYTRSGEVRVSVEPARGADVRLSPRRAELIHRFMRFVFSDVLRVRRRGMKLQMEGSTHNNYYIVPTVKKTREDGSTWIDIDWPFLELIYKHTEEKKLQEIEKPILWEEGEKKDKKDKEKVKKMENPLLKPGEVFVFDAEKYKEAVVTPWYRNQDQPQFFLVAEICWHLTPESAFPSAQHASFRAYYRAKYGAELTQRAQPLLDVDHTSARLNLLTPRYVNRKGVALPVSSERTRRAKRDRLDQKQILVPELCRVHPFAAPLWFAVVALPCVLYRINALLIADEIRRAVAIDVGLGIPRIDDETCPGFQWPPLDFGWSLAEVLNADDKSEKKKDDEDAKKEDKEYRTKEEKEVHQKEIEDKKEEVREKTINDILQEKLDAESGFEIGTWSNEMASSIPQEYDELLEPLPPNLTFCTSSSGGANWSEPIEKPKGQYNTGRTFSMADSDCSYMSSDFDTDDTDMTDGSDDDTDTTGFCSSRNSNAAMGVRIEYKTAHEAEAVDVGRARAVAPAPHRDARDDAADRRAHRDCLREGDAPPEYVEKFRSSVMQHENEIKDNGLLIDKNKQIVDLLPEPNKNIIDNIDNLFKYKHNSTNDQNKMKIIIDNNKNNDKNMSKEDMTAKDNSKPKEIPNQKIIDEIFPYGNKIEFENGQITLESIEKNKRVLLAELKKSLSDEEIKKMNCFSMKDVDIDGEDYVNEKVVNVGFDSKEKYAEKVNSWKDKHEYKPYYMEKGQNGKEFDFDFQPDLEGHPGPSPSLILQALTMSNANDGINLERLETIGDSFLKFAITAYLYCAHPAVHEGKLSHMRSKQVSNLNLYRLGRAKRLGARMIASKFEPHDNWLPPCHAPPPTLHAHQGDGKEKTESTDTPIDNSGCFIPYNLITQHSIPDKSIADCVEALIGAYLLACGPRGALLFMSWLGLRVLPRHALPLPAAHPYARAHARTRAHASRPPRRRRAREEEGEGKDKSKATSPSSSESSSEEEPEGAPPPDWSWPGRAVGALKPYCDAQGRWWQPIYGELKAPPSPLLRYIEDPEGELEQMLSGYDALERTLQYRFKDRSLLLQALTHASHQRNRLTDCYQRLEFLGDAILDYLITRHLYEDPRRHSPGALTDLRSALVNNTIFATLAARHGFHKYFRHMSPGLNEVLTKYVKIQEENGHSISEEHYLIQEDEMEQAEDVEVPKALGDLFESVTGAIFLDSGMSLGAVWRSVGALLSAELDAFSAAAPKSPVRELLEAEPDTAKFGKPERLADGRRVRVCVEVFGRGTFKGVGRNYRIAKGTAARCALRHLRDHRPR